MSMFHLNTIDRLNERLGRIISFLIFILIGIIMFEVVMRYVFNRPTIWVNETSEFAFSAYFLLGGAYTLFHAGHVRVDIVYNRFSSRIRAVLDLITSLFFFLYMSLLLWKGGEMAWDSTMLLERSQTPWAPYIFPVMIIVPIAALLMLLQGVVIFIRTVKSFGGGEHHEH
jgi:TRAP-type mannitol/chloroaromatic compound transport system permease small subunit